MLTVAYIVSFSGMILLPVLLWFYFTRRFALSWKLVLTGALTFIASQVLHIPLVFGMNPLLQTLPLPVNAVDLSTVPGIPADQLDLARQQVEAYWSAPRYMALMGVVERVFAICLHVSLSVMVLYAIAYGKSVWFWLALLWHACVDAVAVFVGQEAGILAVEGIVAGFAIVSVWIVLQLRSQFSQDVESPA